jgi:hypothetical protein
VTRRAGATIAVVDFAAHDREELRSATPTRAWAFPTKQMLALLSDAGFAAAARGGAAGKPLTVKIWTGRRASPPPHLIPSQGPFRMNPAMKPAALSADTPLFAGLPGDIGVSFEFFPPKTEKMARAVGFGATLAPLEPRFVSVTYGAGGSTRERTHATVARIVCEASCLPPRT